MLSFVAGVFIVFMLSQLTVMLRRGLNEIIGALESIDERLASMQADAKKESVS
jgi:hypothetical protein